MRKCHYTNVKGHGRVLIPGCIAVAHSNDISDCTCDHNEKSYEERLSDIEDELKSIRKEIKHLMGINKVVK